MGARQVAERGVIGAAGAMKNPAGMPMGIPDGFAGHVNRAGALGMEDAIATHAARSSDDPRTKEYFRR